MRLGTDLARDYHAGRMLRSSPAVLLVIICATIGCGDSPRKMADAGDSAPAAASAQAQGLGAPAGRGTARHHQKDSLAADTSAADSLTDSTSAKRDSVPPRTRARGPRPFVLSPADSAKWPVKGPEPLPGSLLPEHRIIAYYGNPLSTRMGIMAPGPARLDAPAAGEGGDGVGAGRPRAEGHAGAAPDRDRGAGKAGGREEVPAPDGRQSDQRRWRRGPRSGAGSCSSTSRSGTARLRRSWSR